MRYYADDTCTTPHHPGTGTHTPHRGRMHLPHAPGTPCSGRTLRVHDTGSIVLHAGLLLMLCWPMGHQAPTSGRPAAAGATRPATAASNELCGPLSCSCSTNQLAHGGQLRRPMGYSCTGVTPVHSGTLHRLVSAAHPHRTEERAWPPRATSTGCHNGSRISQDQFVQAYLP